MIITEQKNSFLIPFESPNYFQFPLFDLIKAFPLFACIVPYDIILDPLKYKNIVVKFYPDLKKFEFVEDDLSYWRGMFDC